MLRVMHLRFLELLFSIEGVKRMVVSLSVAWILYVMSHGLKGPS